jgi:hypothetical protein
MKAALLIALGIAVAAAPAPAMARKTGAKHVLRAHGGSVRAELRYREQAGPLHYWSHSRIRIWNHGRLIVDRPAGFGQRPYHLRLLSVRNLDGVGPPEVVLHSYSGGVHCCFATQIFTGTHRVKKQWGHLGVPALRDVDGDGRPEFHGVDTAFAYAFSSFGQSRFPVKVWSYAGGAIHDVTGSFPAEVEADMADQYADYRRARSERDPGTVRSALAAYAADGYSLGQGDAAMEVVLAAVSAGETEATKRDPSEYPDYYESLRTLLRKLGYDHSRGLRLEQFLSPDGQVWCTMAPSDAQCDSGDHGGDDAVQGQRSARLRPDGGVNICSVAVTTFEDVCFQNWGVGARVLAYGSTTERNGVRCTSAPEGVTCTLIGGPGKGKGFTINATNAAKVGP